MDHTKAAKKTVKKDGSLDLGKVQKYFPHYFVVAVTDEDCGCSVGGLHGNMKDLGYALHRAMVQNKDLEKFLLTTIKTHIAMSSFVDLENMFGIKVERAVKKKD